MVDPMVALPDDVLAPDPYAEGVIGQDVEAAPLELAHEELHREMAFRAASFASVMPFAPVNADEVVRRALAKVTNKPGFCLQECRLIPEIPPLWPNASSAARAAVGVRNERRGPGGAYAYWTGGVEGDGHIAIFLPNGLIRSTDAGGRGLWGTRTLEWFDTNWHSLDYVGWADNTNNRRVPGVIREWDEMATPAEFRAVVKDELDGRFEALNLRIDGLVERQQKILGGIDSLDAELDTLATREQASKIRTQLRELRTIATGG